MKRRKMVQTRRGDPMTALRLGDVEIRGHRVHTKAGYADAPNSTHKLLLGAEEGSNLVLQ